MPGNGIQMGSSKLLKDMPSHIVTTHTIHSLRHGGSTQVHITATPTSSFPWQGSALSQCPCASLRQHQHYGSESHNVKPRYRQPCQMWEGATLDPNFCYVRLHPCSSEQDKPQVPSFKGNLEAFADLALQLFI